MSVLVMTRVWALDVPHHEQAVLLALADHADDRGGNVYPSIGYVAWKLGYSDRQVRRIVSDLRKRGVLVVTREGRGKFPPHYRLELSGLPTKAPYRDEQPDKMAAEPEASASNPDILSSLPGMPTAGVTPVTALPDTDDTRADISSARADISDAHPDIAVSAKPSLVNRHLETSPEPSRESSPRGRAREAPQGAERTIDVRKTMTSPCVACSEQVPLDHPLWPACSEACRNARTRARASPGGNAEPAVLTAAALNAD